MYDPDKYAEMYYSADGLKPKDRINALRREKYQQNKDHINAQKRDAYQVRKLDSYKGIDEEMYPGAPLDAYRQKKKTDTRDDIVMTNPGYPKERGRMFNCQRSIIAYELRKRGLDVIATPAVLSKNGAIVVDDAFKHINDVFIGFKPRYKKAGSFDGKTFIEYRLREMGNGARVRIDVVWADKQNLYERDGKEVTLNSSHSFIGENIDGKIRFVDPQTGNDDCSDYFTKVKNGHTMYAQINDLPINEDLIDLYAINRRGE